MSSAWWTDDDRFFAELREALGGDPPPRVVESAKAAWTWRDVDAELASLTYDSALDDDRAVTVRAELAIVRRMTFESGDRRVTIELEIGDEALLGQVWPGQEGEVEVHTVTGITSTPVDAVGGFLVRPLPSGPFRLYCRVGDAIRVATTWINL
jgi:hypothetical protein